MRMHRIEKSLLNRVCDPLTVKMHAHRVRLHDRYAIVYVND